MSTVKTKIDQGLVLAYLRDKFDASISSVEFIAGGESSQAFSFHSNGRDFVVRANSSSRGFRKDQYVHDHFSSEAIPIPEVVQIGEYEGYHFAISTRAHGSTIKNLPAAEVEAMLPDIFSVLDAIHAMDVSSMKGFGKWNTNGEGEFDSWKDFILGVGMHLESSKLFETTFLEKDVWDTLYVEIERLSEFCPDERFLVHGDYGFDNLIADEGKVTGVLDWAESMYGDFVFDIAWLGFWAWGRDDIYEREYRKRNIPHFKERLLCYKLRIGLGSLSFYAFSQQKDKYDLVKGRTLNLLKNEFTSYNK